MRNLPRAIIQVLRQFELLFSERVWEWAKILLVGAILAPGKRTVTAVLRVMGLSDDAQCQNYHRVLNRAVWSPRALSQVLLRQLVSAFVPPDAPIVLGLDDHIERRRGAKLTARGIYRDPVRSSTSFFVKTSGLRWLCMMLVPIPWAQRVWALPFLSVLVPSERYHQERGQRHKTLTDWARQMITQVRRWLPDRLLVVVADSTYAALELLAACQGLPRPVTLITRLRLDAGLYEPAPPRKPGQKGRTPKKGKRQPTLLARLSDPATDWQTVSVRWYGGVTRTVRLATGKALWYHPGKPLVAIRWVLLTDPEKHVFGPVNLMVDWTSQEDTPRYVVLDQVADHRAWRRGRKRHWIEPTFRDLKSAGFDLEQSDLEDRERIEHLVLAMLWSFVWMLFIGQQVIVSGQRTELEARHKRDYSRFRLGRDWLRRALALGKLIPVGFDVGP